MNSCWKGKCAVVTGAASGIGLELSKALADRGAQVRMTDIDSVRLEKAANSLGPDVSRSVLDVRDADAVREFIGQVALDSGRIDFLFNNAGILLAGEAHEFDTGHFDRIIDVNIRGVVNGTMAAYPLMVRQGFGHIVNTASLAGLMPSPLLSAYGMSKHAVVGLTTSMRFEAERYGVRISAICPAGVDTPMLEAAPLSGLDAIAWSPDVPHYLKRLAGTLCPADKVARDALRGVERNKAIIIIPARGRLTELVYRFVPGLVHAVGRRELAAELGERRGSAPGVS